MERKKHSKCDGERLTKLFWMVFTVDCPEEEEDAALDNDPDVNGMPEVDENEEARFSTDMGSLRPVVSSARVKRKKIR